MAGIGDLVARTAAQSGGSWLTPEQVQFLRGLQLKGQDPETTYRALSDDEWQMEYDPNSGEMVRRPPSGAVDQGANSVSGQSDWMMPVKGTSPSYNLNSLDQDALSAAGFQSKYNQVERLPDGTLKVTLQRPGMHKYDTMEAYYKVDPATGQTTLVGGAPSRQTSSGQELRDAVEEGAGHIGGAMLAATGIANPAFFGTGAIGAAGAGAAASGGITAAAGGGWEDTLKNALKGAVLAGGADYLMGSGELGSLESFGQASFNPSYIGGGANGANGLDSFYGPPGSQEALWQQSLTAPPTTANLPSPYDPASASINPETGETYFQNGELSAPQGTQVNPETGELYSLTESPAQFNSLEHGLLDPSTGAPVAGVGGAASGTGGISDWIAKNPLEAAQLGLMGAGVLAGGAPGSAIGGAMGGGSQAGLTATQAPAFQRQYVAPPAGYRPGFDPEHKFFTGIGSVGIGQIPQTPSGSSTG